MNADTLGSLAVTCALIAGLTIAGLVLVRFFATRAIRLIETMKHLRQARQQQLITFVYIAQWGASVLIVGAAVLMFLSTFGVDISPIIASVGVVGLGLSLGAQSFIKDLVGGVLILLENHFVVGDTIQVGDVAGQVEQLTLRATYVRDLNGNLVVVPNGEMRIVVNQTKDWSRAVVDVAVANEVDLDRVMDLLNQLVEGLAHDPAFKPQIVDAPQVIAPLSQVDWAITARILVKTQPGKQWGVSRELRKRVADAFAKEGIATPYPRQEVALRGLEGESIHSIGE
jgi:small-conductance mechanosensitive channel